MKFSSLLKAQCSTIQFSTKLGQTGETFQRKAKVLRSVQARPHQIPKDLPSPSLPGWNGHGGDLPQLPISSHFCDRCLWRRRAASKESRGSQRGGPKRERNGASIISRDKHWWKWYSDEMRGCWKEAVGLVAVVLKHSFCHLNSAS